MYQAPLMLTLKAKLVGMDKRKGLTFGQSLVFMVVVVVSKLRVVQDGHKYSV